MTKVLTTGYAKNERRVGKKVEEGYSEKLRYASGGHCCIPRIPDILVFLGMS